MLRRPLSWVAVRRVVASLAPGKLPPGKMVNDTMNRRPENGIELVTGPC